MVSQSQDNKSKAEPNRGQSRSKSGHRDLPDRSSNLFPGVTRNTGLSEILDALSLASAEAEESSSKSNEKTNKGSSAKSGKPPVKPMPNPFAANYQSKAPVKIETNESSAKVKSPAKPMPNPFAKNLAAKSFVPKDFSNGGGKFANSATTEADGGKDDSPAQATQRSVHRRPKFKQVLPSSRPATLNRNDDNKENAKLKSLLNYSSEEPDDESDNEKAGDSELKIEGLRPRLLPHQERGVKFMARRERGRKFVRGGLLADDMGLGKTIQSIAIILYHPPESDEAPKTTLVVTPLAVMDQWKDEILQMAPKLRVGTYHGSTRTRDVSNFEEYDVLVTTYDVVWREYEKAGPLFCREWHRIIADEAHSFRGPKTKKCAAMAELKSNGRRWALSGTPLHNNLIDLYPLFKFIGVGYCTTVEQFEAVYTKDKKLEALKKQLSAIMLRRTQKVLRSFLPRLVIHPTKTQMTPIEQEVYNSWRPFRGRSAKCTQLTAIMRMRQACDGLLSPEGKVELGWSDNTDTASQGIDIKAVKQDEESSESDVDSLKTGAVNESKDLADILNMLSIKPKAGEKTNYSGHRNSKIREVHSILLKERKRKTVLFSSFVTMLVALQPMLEFEGIKYLQYDGRLTADKRREMLATFRDEKSEYTVLLCSLQTASVGLNLTSASQVVMVDPWWNPQIVDQAIKRVHRLGQVREVDCYQLYSQDSLDERMMHIQQAKRQLATNLIDGAEELTDADKGYLLYGDDDEDNEDAKEEAVDGIGNDTKNPDKSSGKTKDADGNGNDTKNPGKSFDKTKNPDGNGAAQSLTADIQDEGYVKVDLPWKHNRTLPKIPKHKKVTG